MSTSTLVNQRLTFWMAARGLTPSQLLSILKLFRPVTSEFGMKTLLSDEPMRYQNTNRGLAVLEKSLDQRRINRVVMSSLYPASHDSISGSLIAEIVGDNSRNDFDSITLMLDYVMNENRRQDIERYISIASEVIEVTRPLCAFISDRPEDKPDRTLYEQDRAVLRSLTADLLRYGHRGAFWVTYMGREHCDVLGGKAAVLSAAPAPIVRVLADGVWIQLAKSPPADSHALAAFEKYAEPLYAWMKEPQWLDSRAQPGSSPSVSTQAAPATWNSAPNRAIRTLSMNRQAARRRTVPYRIVSHEDIEAVVNVHLTAAPDEAQQEAVGQVVMAWVRESPTFDVEPELRGFHEVTGPNVNGRVMRWIIGFGSIDQRRAVRRLSRLLAAIEGVSVERILVGTEHAP